MVYKKKDDKYDEDAGEGLLRMLLLISSGDPRTLTVDMDEFNQKAGEENEMNPDCNDGSCEACANKIRKILDACVIEESK